MVLNTNERLIPPEHTFPDGDALHLWRTKIEPHARLEVINAPDLQWEQTLTKLGINQSPLTKSFLITDEEEIRRRLRLMEFLHQNPHVMKCIKGMERTSPLPTAFGRFIDYFGSDCSPHWVRVRALLDALQACEGSVPSNLSSFATHLRASLNLEPIEDVLCDRIGEQIIRITVMEGTFETPIFLNDNGRVASLGTPTEDDHKYRYHHEENIPQETVRLSGHKRFSFQLSRALDQPYKPWTQRRPFTWQAFQWVTWPSRFITDWKNDSRRTEAMKAMVINSPEQAPDLIREIREALKTRLANLNFGRGVKQYFEKAMLKAYFRYDQDGLTLSVFGIVPNVEEYKHELAFEQFGGYNPEQIRAIEKMRRWCERTVIGERIKVLQARMERIIARQDKDLFTKSFKAESPQTDENFRCFALTNLYGTAEFEAAVQALTTHRDFFEQHLKVLQDVCAVLSQLQEKAKEWRTSLCFAEILRDDHVVESDNLFPLELVNRDDVDWKQVVLLNGIPALNGQLIGFTGATNSGKSVSILTLVLYIGMTQSGLPVFGRRFMQNVKRQMGLAFIERGRGSTSSVFLDKIAAIDKRTRRSEGRNVVIAVDELGMNTDTEEGSRFARGLLDTIRQRGHSCLFSTGHRDVSTFARDTLSAQCLAFQRDHTITPGIGEAEYLEMVRNRGLGHLLTS